MNLPKDGIRLRSICSNNIFRFVLTCLICFLIGILYFINRKKLQIRKIVPANLDETDVCKIFIEQNFDQVNGIVYTRYDLRNKQILKKISSCNKKINKLQNNGEFTIIIPTYHRDPVISRAIKHYSKFKNKSKIIVIWFNEYPMPNKYDIINFINSTERLELDFYWMPNHIRYRYFPYPTINTEAIFNVDDDILVNEQSANKAFKYWQVI